MTNRVTKFWKYSTQIYAYTPLFQNKRWFSCFNYRLKWANGHTKMRSPLITGNGESSHVLNLNISAQRSRTVDKRSRLNCGSQSHRPTINFHHQVDRPMSLAVRVATPVVCELPPRAYIGTLLYKARLLRNITNVTSHNSNQCLKKAHDKDALVARHTFVLVVLPPIPRIPFLVCCES
jgi:hypothetical protein